MLFNKCFFIMLLLAISGCQAQLAQVRKNPLPDAKPLVLKNRDKLTTVGHLAITRIAHSGVLLDFNGHYILTDPWFSESSQYHPGELIGIALDKLPKLSAIIASHAHSDHFDLNALRHYPDKNVLFFVGPDMVKEARKHGFTNVQELKPYEYGLVDKIKITAVPARHGVAEVNFILQGNGYNVFFGGDTLLIPEHDEIISRFPHIDVAFYPVNGLTIRPLGNKQVVMSAEEAAILAQKMRPQLAIPIHYAFKGGWFTETFVLKRKGNAEEFLHHIKTKAPDIQANILETGQRLFITK